MAQLNLDLVLPRETATVPLVRHILKGSLQELGVVADDVADLELAVSEACANVVLHAGGESDEYEIRTIIEDGRCEVTVIDTGPGFDHRDIDQRPRPGDGSGGRGLILMRALVDAIEFDSVPGRGTLVCLMKTLRFDANGGRRLGFHVPGRDHWRALRPRNA